MGKNEMKFSNFILKQASKKKKLEGREKNSGKLGKIFITFHKAWKSFRKFAEKFSWLFHRVCNSFLIYPAQRERARGRYETFPYIQSDYTNLIIMYEPKCEKSNIESDDEILKFFHPRTKNFSSEFLNTLFFSPRGECLASLIDSSGEESRFCGGIENVSSLEIALSFVQKNPHSTSGHSPIYWNESFCISFSRSRV